MIINLEDMKLLDQCDSCGHVRMNHKDYERQCNVAYSNTGCPCKKFIEPQKQLKDKNDR